MRHECASQRENCASTHFYKGGELWYFSLLISSASTASHAWLLPSLACDYNLRGRAFLQFARGGELRIVALVPVDFVLLLMGARKGRRSVDGIFRDVFVVGFA
jgi:hypothetical protein